MLQSLCYMDGIEAKAASLTVLAAGTVLIVSYSYLLLCCRLAKAEPPSRRRLLHTAKHCSEKCLGSHEVELTADMVISFSSVF